MAPEQLLLGSHDLSPGGGWPQYDLSRDGRFLVNVEVAGATAPITLVQNWRPPK